MPDGEATAPRTYIPRAANGTRLQRLVGATLPSLVREAARSLPNGLPRFVVKSLDAYVGCGDFAQGFVALRCERCPVERFVAFSCKTRGFCPSCGGKRMTALAAHLVDAVLPRVPVRQFVLTVPFVLRAKMAYDAVFAAEVRSALHTSVQRAYARRARIRGIRRGHTGGVTAVQRFGSGLNLHVHLHALVLDGVFVADDATKLRFASDHSWSANEIGLVLLDLVTRLLQRGLIDFEADALTEMEALGELDPLGVASCLHRIALGPRRGQRVERVGATKRLRDARLELDAVRLKARYAGFDLEASVRIPAHDRSALERLCRYLLRPPLAEKRVHVRDDAKVEIELKSPWPDGTTHLVFTPLELTEKIAALIPRPHENLLVYHGVLAANAKRRADVVAHGRGDATVPASRTANPDSPTRSRSPSDWATMMRRGLELDVLTCPGCGARLRIRTLFGSPRVAAPHAARLGLARTRAGPADLPQRACRDTHYEPDPDFVDPYDA
jgi:hypothetical protein